MHRTEAFERYIAPAKAYPEFWRLLVGLLIATLIYVGGLMGSFAALGVLAGVTGGVPFGISMQDLSSPEATLFLLGTFLFMALAAIGAAQMHRRGLASLIGPAGAAFRDFWRAALLTALIFGLTGALIGLMIPDPVLPNLPPGQWLLFLPLALPLLFIQTTSEELLFRGYLMQQLAARFRSPLIWMGLPAVLFALGHTDTTIDPRLTLMIVLATGLFGIVAADVTRLTGNLGAAMGIHFVNNFFALLLVSVQGELSGLSLFHSPYTMEQTDKLMPLLAADMLVVAFLWLVLRRRLARG